MRILIGLTLLACTACGAELSSKETRDGGRSASGDGTASSEPSCVPSGAGTTTCGASGESCCTTLSVAGGTYPRTYTSDADGGATGEADPATVSSFRLDKYEVTVGRFRQFVNAWNGGSGYLPTAGSGKHTHLNGGLGLADSGKPGGYETGWNAADWNANIAPTTSNLVDSIGQVCYPGNNAQGPYYSTWTAAPGDHEDLPINCVNWYEAYAFCIWDGGFLPSEAEWGYAAAGGAEERQYPWGNAAPGTACPGTGCAYAIYDCDYPSSGGSCTGVSNLAPVGTAALGAGAWGQLDLAGNVWEWTLDLLPVEGGYTNPCLDCAQLTDPGESPPTYGGGADQIIRGGNYTTPASNLAATYRGYDPPQPRDSGIGIRCARTP